MIKDHEDHGREATFTLQPEEALNICIPCHLLLEEAVEIAEFDEPGFDWLNLPGCCKGTEEDMYYKMKHVHLPDQACHWDVTGETLRGVRCNTTIG